ncbi:hypothetical protein [Robertmurraya sp.]|uniref:hypothetical protein n=1 Tax=Robertmurraya sp. TaxID=2837525 RepID=UPI0037041561
MTAKAPTPMPEDIQRSKAPTAPPRSCEPKPNNLTLEQAFEIMFEKYKGALQELSEK